MYCIVLVTVKDKLEAQDITKKLIQEKLAACVNILDSVESHFWWQGKVDSSQEALMVIKTKEDLFDPLVKMVKSLHSYSTPEIIALPIIKGDMEYLNWIKDSVK